MGTGDEGDAGNASNQRLSTAGAFAHQLGAAAASVGTACGLWAIVRLIARTSFFEDAQWMDFLGALVLLLACWLPCACRFLGFRWVLGVLCLLGVLPLQRSELGQQALHQYGRTEHVQVLQVQESEDGMSGGGTEFYTVAVLDGPPLAPIPGGTFVDWHWTVGGTYAVTVDPQGRAPVERGSTPGPPVVQQVLQVPLVLGLACALWQSARLLQRRGRLSQPGAQGPMCR